MYMQATRGPIDCFHTTAKLFWILIRDAHFELKFKIRKKDRVYAKSRRKTLFEMRISNHGTEVFSSYKYSWILGGGASIPLPPIIPATKKASCLYHIFGHSCVATRGPMA